MNTTGERLRKLREEKRLSQGDVAKLINLSRSAYVAYETGRSRPIRRINELCQLFDVSSDYILGKDTNEPAEPKYSPDEEKLIEIYRKLDDRGKQSVLRTADGELDMLEGK